MIIKIHDLIAHKNNANFWMLFSMIMVVLNKKTCLKESDRLRRHLIFVGNYPFKASAPLTISSISLVIAAWRALL
jgi:hypothetical protein